jgi:hypothetical protein
VPPARAAPGRPPTPAGRTAASRKRSGGAWSLIVFVIIFLVASGVGKQILDALSDLFDQ